MPKQLKPEDVEAFRTRMTRAAEALFAERGVAAVSMRELAKALGVSPMTAYRYFQDKSEILAAVRARAFNRFADALEAADSAAAPTAIGRAAAVGNAYLDFAARDPDAYRLMFDLSQPDEGLYPDLVEASVRARRPLERMVGDLIDAGVIRSGDPAALTYAFWAAAHGLVVLNLAGKLGAPQTFDTVRETLFSALILGLAPAGIPQPA